ncbi:MAG: hypothetical protein IPP55_15750 [Anaerolineales bacterium]|jgi:hypothetical protein|nr:hypothetical protein [Anaerolineales bacterium]MBK9781481.1 hypothetical protein [Anaerolineales bacterium]
MQSEEKTILQRVVENFALTGNASDEQVTVVNLPKGKSSIVENDRSVMLKEYKFNEKLIWAGYSSRSNTVYLSVMSG